jgi:diguanylate cyclase (GGDEF)-like protein
MAVLEAQEASRQAGQERTGEVGRCIRAPSLALAYVLLGGSAALAAASGCLGAAEPAVIFALGLTTLAALVVSVCVRRPSHLWPWVAIAVALGLFLIGAAARSQLQTMGNLSSSRSLLPDLLLLPGYLLLGGGLLGFSQTGTHGPLRHSGLVLDGLIAALALAALAWVFAVQPVLFADRAPLATKVILIAYPSMSIFLVVVTLRIAFNPAGERVPAFWLMLAGMLFMFIGDALFLLTDINVIHVPAQLLDLPYALAYLGAGAAALHPTMRRLTEPGRSERSTASRGRIALVGVALLIPALLTVQRGAASPADRVALFLLIAALTGAAVLRIVQALRTAERSEARLAFQATHDSLTGLPNRRVMEQHLSRLLERPPVDDTHVALLYLDLDRFKLVNDTLGHSHGDELLIAVARRLGENVRPTDLVTRVGGDEFMVVLGHVLSVSQALDLANRLRICLRAPFLVHETELYVSASIGLAFASGEDREASAEALARDADTALYQAKDAGRDAVALFDASMRARVSERVGLEHDLHDAVALDQLHLVYQPIVSLRRGPSIGMEALVRWAHPTRGVIPPMKFIPLAEEAGLIAPIGSWVLEQAVSQLAAWCRRSPLMKGLYVSVNLSAAQLHDDRIVEHVADLLALHGLEGSSLCLELTESAVMEDPLIAAAALTDLRRLGVQIAIDDFGSQYSSLAYIKRFPATILKIDKSFVGSLVAQDSSDATLIAAVVAMARALGVSTIAEGVETAGQAARLTELGCDAAQGYLYSRPVRAESLPAVVQSLSSKRLQLVRA